MRLQQSDPIFNMGVNVKMPAFNFKSKNIVTMLTREEWTRGPGTPPVVTGLLWFTDEFRMEGTGATGYGQSVGRRLSISLGRYAKCFQAEIYAIFACAYGIQLYGRPEKNVSICTHSHAVLKDIQATRTSPLVQQCQKALNDISTQHTVGLYWVPGHAGV